MKQAIMIEGGLSKLKKNRLQNGDLISFCRMICLILGIIISSGISYADNESLFDMPIVYDTEYTTADSTDVSIKIAALENVKSLIEVKNPIITDSLTLRYYNALMSAAKACNLKKKELKAQVVGNCENMIRVAQHEYGRQSKEHYSLKAEFQGYERGYNRLERAFTLDTLAAYPTPLVYSHDDMSSSERDRYLKLLYDIDLENFENGWEWITDEYRTSITKEFPTTYHLYQNHPEYSIVFIRRDGAWDVDRAFAFDQKGNLQRVLYDMEGKQSVYKDWEVKKLIQNEIYYDDFRNNKYDIQSYDPEIILYVELILSGDLEKIESELMATAFATALVGSVVSNLAPHQYQKNQILSKLKVQSIEQLNDFVKNIDKKKMQIARRYIEQLEKDHDNEFWPRRFIRKDDTSYYLSFCDDMGKMCHLALISYKPNGPFEVSREVTVIK